MGKLNVTRVIAFLMIATFATSMLTACGDGKDKKRTKTNRNLSDKPAAADDGKKETPAGTDTPPPGTDAGNTDTPPADDNKGDTTVVDQDELAKKAQALKQIEDYMKGQAEAGTLIDKSGLAEGKYKLTKVDSAVRYMFKQEDARGLQISELADVGDGAVQLKEHSAFPAGMVAEHQLAGRSIEIALSFEVKKENGVFAGERASFSPAILKTDVTNKMAVTSSLAASAADASTVRSSMVDMLKGTAASDISYSMTDENNRKLIMQLRKVSETELHVVISVDEEVSSDSDANSYMHARQIVLTYTFEKAAAADENNVVLTQPEDPVQPPAQQQTETGASDDDLAKRM